MASQIVVLISSIVAAPIDFPFFLGFKMIVILLQIYWSSSFINDKYSIDRGEPKAKTDS